MNQDRLPGTLKDAPKARRVDDFVGLFPQGVMPTNLHILQQGTGLLVIKSLDYGQDNVKAQRRIFSMLSRFGRFEDSPGSITCVVVWGLGTKTGRTIVVFDHQGEHPAKPMSLAEWRIWVREWFDSQSGR